MRLGAWLCVSSALLLFGGCSGGYPLPPTPCDDWCDATKGTWSYSCGGPYQPASCVTDCEAQDLDNERCTNEFDTAITCYRTTPGAAARQCDFNTTGPPLCEGEVLVLAACVGPYLGAPQL